RKEFVCRDFESGDWRRGGSESAGRVPDGARSAQGRRAARHRSEDGKDRVGFETGALRFRKERLLAGSIGGGDGNSRRRAFGRGGWASAGVFHAKRQSAVGRE